MNSPFARKQRKARVSNLSFKAFQMETSKVETKAEVGYVNRFLQIFANEVCSYLVDEQVVIEMYE